eukprot:m.237997 g.237997  ORF g.237997 m.237997 type:complete len:419 (-) comp10915_c2_seq2:76-1332(-)
MDGDRAPLLAEDEESRGAEERGDALRLVRDVTPPSAAKPPRRDLVAFWLFGLTNNYSYVIMLSAAVDILKKIAPHLGTGVVLLADVLPTIAIKSLAPFFMQRLSYRIRIIIAIAFAFLSFLLAAVSNTLWLTIVGVCCASISSGLGEISFLSMTTHYHKATVSAWSSGTGGAGVVGALSYLGLTAIMSPRDTLLLLTVVPTIMAVCYFFVLSHDPDASAVAVEARMQSTAIQSPQAAKSPKTFTLQEKIALIKPLILPYMAPLFVVYAAEYLINQGLYENVYWDNIFASKKVQYRIYQSLYQLGVFISRSSAEFVPIDRIWIPSLLQLLNLILLSLDAKFKVLPYFELYWLVIVYEGLLGGAAYVNAFRMVRLKTCEEHREFSLGASSMADSYGIATAGALAIWYKHIYGDLTGRHQA